MPSSFLIHRSDPEVCLVFLNTWASEGYDRDSLELNWNGTTVVEAVAASCSNTIVITHSSGLNVLPFANHENVCIWYRWSEWKISMLTRTCLR